MVHIRSLDPCININTRAPTNRVAVAVIVHANVRYQRARIDSQPFQIL